MPKYMMLSTLSERGLQTLRANPERLREVNKDVEELGAKVLHQWFVLGPHDFVNIVEAESSAVIAEPERPATMMEASSRPTSRSIRMPRRSTT